MYYLFPFHLVPKDSNIVLYGAGNAGKNFIKQIAITNYCNVVGIVDRNAANIKYAIRGIQVMHIEWLLSASYDYVVITIVDKDKQKEIRETLQKTGISKEKIISFVSEAMDWDRPTFGYLSQGEEYELNKKVGNYLEKINPQLLLSSDRIDVIVRYLLFKDWMNEISCKVHESLFSRFVMARTGGREGTSYFSGNGKNSVQEFLQKGKQLCEDIKNNGFDEKHFIPLGYERKPFDGLHRLAAALAAGEDIYVHEYADRAALSCDMDWFKENGFSLEDRVRITRGFTDVYPGKCAMFVLFAPFSNLWEFIEGQLSQKFKKVAVLDFKYEDNYIAFEYVLRQIYWDTAFSNEWLTRKLDMLNLAPLQYRIIVISDERGNKDFYSEAQKLKHELRQALSVDVDGRVPIQCHSSDSEEEFIHLKHIFLSANQYNWDMRRINQYYRAWFLTALGELKMWCKNNGIRLEDVCVVGSAVLELHGIREAQDLNFIVKSGLRYDGTSASPDLKLKKDYGIDEHGNQISDDLIIGNCEFHTVFSDVKFCNPEFVYNRKKARGMQKDLLDLKRMDDWHRMLIGMEDRRFLNQQVERELFKRGLLRL